METLIDRHAPEQLQLPLSQAEEGLLPFRLLEPITSLGLTPFALKAAKASKASTVGELAILVFEKDKECLAMGQGHIEEIRRKIELFIGRPPYALEQSIDLGSLLRLTLLPLDGADRGIIALRCLLQPIVALTAQEAKEAEMSLLRDRDGKFKKALETARVKGAATTLSLLDQIVTGLIRPWIARRGGIIHEQELIQFCYEKSNSEDFESFERIRMLLQNILQTPFLFTSFLCQVEGKIWALTEKEQVQAVQIISDAKTLVGKERDKANLKELARALARCRLTGWEECSSHTIERILFWYFT